MHATKYRGSRGRRGALVVYAAIAMVVVMAMVAFAADLGFLCLEKDRCQNAADAAALAAATSISEESGKAKTARAQAIEIARLNLPTAGNVLKDRDVVFGVWDTQTRRFDPSNSSPNAAQVTVRRSAANCNAVSLFFARVLGNTRAEIDATAIAMVPKSGAQVILLDEDCIDSDEPAIELAARGLGIPPDTLISDRNGDGIIDIPPGTTLELPTGQTGDEALFDTTSAGGAFPFGTDTTYTQLDLLLTRTALQSRYRTRDLTDVTWKSSDAPHPEFKWKKVLDPVPGVTPLSTNKSIMSLPNPDRIFVGRVYKSDVSVTERDPTKYGSITCNLLGEVRGLLAFRLLSATKHPKGGSYLPMITLKVENPKSVDLDGGLSGSSTKAPSARIVR